MAFGTGSDLRRGTALLRLQRGISKDLQRRGQVLCRRLLCRLGEPEDIRRGSKTMAGSTQKSRGLRLMLKLLGVIVAGTTAGLIIGAVVGKGGDDDKTGRFKGKGLSHGSGEHGGRSGSMEMTSRMSDVVCCAFSLRCALDKVAFLLPIRLGDGLGVTQGTVETVAASGLTGKHGSHVGVGVIIRAILGSIIVADTRAFAVGV